jgi:S1-C subfamily serine protease
VPARYCQRLQRTVFHVFHSKDSWLEYPSVHGKDPDVELLRADATNVPFLKLGSTTNSVEGQRVVVIGNPEDLGFTVSDRIISAFRENRALIQITAPISHGSSGSPVLDADSGQVLGIATGIWREGQNLNFAIVSEKIRDVIAKTGSISQTPQPVAVATATPSATGGSAAYYFNRAFDEMKNGNYKGAITDFNEAIME